MVLLIDRYQITSKCLQMYVDLSRLVSTPPPCYCYFLWCAGQLSAAFLEKLARYPAPPQRCSSGWSSFLDPLDQPKQQQQSRWWRVCWPVCCYGWLGWPSQAGRSNFKRPPNILQETSKTVLLIRSVLPKLPLEIEIQFQNYLDQTA